jgi:ornithine cyclodeaminase/alanine dehydrogenase-like protein (mu-crystallin family)
MRVLTADHVRQAIDPAAALSAVRAGFVALVEGGALSPPSFDLDLSENHGELHVKGGYLRGGDYVAIKLASGFYDNPALGLPTAGGLTVILSAHTGEFLWLVADQGLLTELRTAAAGALAAELLARPDVGQVTIVGAGGQARYQLAALLEVRRPAGVTVVARRRQAADAYAEEAQKLHNLAVQSSTDVEAAVHDADIVVTTTPARSPVLQSDWVRPGTHVTAMGSDLPDKNELDPRLLVRADKLVVDSLPSALTSGELHHAVQAGLVTSDDVYAELGEIAAGRVPGRERDDEITVADLTGLGVQDVAISALLADRAAALGLGD